LVRRMNNLNRQSWPALAAQNAAYLASLGK